MNLFQAEVTTPNEITKLIIEADTFSDALDRICELFKEDTVEELSITQLIEESVLEQLGNRVSVTSEYEL